MPRSIAFFSAGTSASGSLAEMAMASTFWAISALMTSIWPFGGGRGRAGVDDLDVAEFLGGFLRRPCWRPRRSRCRATSRTSAIFTVLRAAPAGEQRRGQRGPRRAASCRCSLIFLPFEHCTSSPAPQARRGGFRSTGLRPALGDDQLDARRPRASSAPRSSMPSSVMTVAMRVEAAQDQARAALELAGSRPARPARRPGRSASARPGSAAGRPPSGRAGRGPARP